MKLVAFILFLVGCIGVNAETPSPATDWKTLMGYKARGTEAFMDRNSFIKSVDDKGNEYTNGVILITYDDPVNVPVDDKPVPIRSIAKHIIVQCSSARLMQVADFYFSVEKPTRADKPVAGREYPADPAAVIQLGKGSIFYMTFCPTYI